MKSKETPIVLSATTATSAGTNVLGTIPCQFLDKGDVLNVDLIVTGATGGTLDITIQRRTSSNPSNVWMDWARYPLIASAAPQTGYTFACDGSGTTSIQTVGVGSDATPNVQITAGTYVNSMPGDLLRVVCTNTAASAGGSVKITLTPYTEKL